MVLQLRSAASNRKSISPDNKEKGVASMEKLSQGKHWTSKSVEDFTYRIASDFLAQVETRMENDGITQSEVAVRLGRTAGRVSQLFNAGNMTLGTAVRLGHVTGLKVAIVGYDDNDANNNCGPVNSEIFHQCWKQMGSPQTFFELSNTVMANFLYGYLGEAVATDIKIDPKFIPESVRSAITQTVLIRSIH
jgi:hypothetical protein